METYTAPWVFTYPKVETSIYQLKLLDDFSHSGKASNSQTSSATSTQVAPLDCQRHDAWAFQVPQKSRTCRYFEGTINRSPQCFWFKCFNIYVLEWFHKFQREGRLLMTSVISAEPSATTTEPPLKLPFFNFIYLFQQWLRQLISSAGSQGDARADVWPGRHRSFVGAGTRPGEELGPKRLPSRA